MIDVAEHRELLTITEASMRYGIPVSTLRFWRERGELTKYTRGRTAVVDADEVRRKAQERNEVRRED